MTTTRLVIGIAAAILAAGCATRDTAPYAQGKDCFYPACSIAVDVVDDGKGGKKLQVEADGNVRMGTRHRLVAIVWNLRTPGYEFRGSSVRPRVGGGNQAEWHAQITSLGNSDDNVSVSNLNTDRVALFYDLTVYPSFGTAGQPMSTNPVIVNDPFQGINHGYLMMR